MLATPINRGGGGKIACGSMGNFFCYCLHLYNIDAIFTLKLFANNLLTVTVIQIKLHFIQAAR
jgi:hypothetical protein